MTRKRKDADLKSDESPVEVSQEEARQTSASDVSSTDQAKDSVDGRTVLRLLPETRMANVESLHEQLAQMLQGEGKIVIDASEVETMSTAAYQMLTALAQDLRDHGAAITWESPSEAFCHDAALLDLESDLGLSGP